MNDFYQIAIVVIFVALAVAGVVLLLRGSRRYNMNIIWWFMSLILAFLPCPVAYFDAKKRYLTNVGAASGEVIKAKRQFIVSLIYILGIWFSIAICCLCLILSAKGNPAGATFNVFGWMFWLVAGFTVVYIVVVNTIKTPAAE